MKEVPKLPARRPPRVFLAAGEASGDRYGAMLIEQLRALAPGVVVTGIGGPRMAAAGMVCHRDMMALATVGFSNVVRRFPDFAAVYRAAIRRLAEDQPDVLVPIDNPGFNLYLARQARQRGIPVCYFVCPQVWAWGRWRLKKIVRVVDRILAIFPFEVDLYRARGADVRYVGHPLLDYVSAAPLDRALIHRLEAPAAPLIGLLPGSRVREVTRVFAPMARAAAELLRLDPATRFVVACAQEEHVPLARTVLRQAGLPATTEILHGKTFEVMRASHLCLACSGTVTLELTWFRRPMVIVYRSGGLGRFLKSFIVKVPYIGLPNIIAGREIVPEHFLFNDDPTSITASARSLLEGTSRWRQARDDLEAVIGQLGSPGASARAAREVLDLAGVKFAPL